MTNQEKVEYVAGARLDILNMLGQEKPIRIRQTQPIPTVLGAGDTLDEAWYNALEFYFWARVQNEPEQVGVTRDMMARLDQVRDL